ncbi:alpha 1,2-mannosyltransferase 2.4.1 [Linnemannia schmuckeri]|uniref:Alpha 1,2-mannosyltransferase 2.4.1 n=1 Tax=Linnemannia schmuckeri TaxID=64567 RepID=A0A9P5RXQ7_9FUNG|nr:alpha 1,2-mannosyltransferase 2.4.1 [Linnemannia schmuckeri]
MIHAPTRYARVVRALIPFAAVCGLLYLFLVTFIPQHFGPGINRQGNSLAGEPFEAVYTDSAELPISPDGLQKQERIVRDGQSQQQQQTSYPDMRDPLQPDEGGAGASLDSIVSEQEINPAEDDDSGVAVNRGSSSRTRSKTAEPMYEVVKANGVLVMVITLDEEVQEARETIRHIEDRFNRGRYYPWVILSPQPLSDRAQTLLQHIPFASRLKTNNSDNEVEEDNNRGVATPITFGLIPREQWKFPRWIEALKVRNGDFSRLKLGLNATSVAVRQRRRYMSGFLAQHDLLDGYEFFWRIDPGLVVFCDLDDDPILAMKHSGQKFAWSVSAAVNEASTPGAWSIIQKFKETYPNHIPQVNDENFITRESLDAFSACSYNVQNSIGSIEFFRSPGYTAYFNMIDKEGPIYYECWEDDTVITIGLSLLLPRNNIRFLKEMGWGYSNGGAGSGTGIGVVPLKGSTASAAVSAALTTEAATTQILYCPRNPEQNRVCHCDPKWKAPRSHLSCTSYWMGLTTSPRRHQRRVCTPDENCKIFVSILEPELLKGEEEGQETIVSPDIVVPAGNRGEEYY